jgi:hypothetical protein
MSQVKSLGAKNRLCSSENTILAPCLNSEQLELLNLLLP